MNRYDFDELYDSLPSHGWLTYNEARLLYDTAEPTSGPILEVGSYQGRSTCLLASLGRPVLAIDPFDGFHSELSGNDIYAALVANLQQRGYRDNVLIFRQKIEQWRSVIGNPQIGFAYLDGDHTYEGTLAQIVKTLELKVPVIAMHDVNDSGDGLQVKRAALEMLGSWTERVERLAVWKRLGGAQ
jgi:hypothetical protein